MPRILSLTWARQNTTGFKVILCESPHGTIKSFVAARTPRYFSGWLEGESELLRLKSKTLDSSSHIASTSSTTPTYAILGATGKTGGALVDLLIQAPDTHINAYVRSKAKLLTQRPAMENAQNVKIFEGSLSDIPLLASTLVPEVDAAFCVLGINENIPGVRIAQDTANSVIAALCHIREKDTDYQLPKLIFLSSGSMNPIMSAKLPAAGKWIIDRGMSHAYADLWFAEETLRLHKSWLDVTFVQPSALTEDVQKGHKLSLDKMAEASPFVSYPDLAAGMIEIAKSGPYAWMGVSVVATGKDIKFEPKAPPQILRGLVWHCAPWLYAPCKYLRIVS